MEMFFDCLPCTLRQVLEAARMATDDIHIQDKVMTESIQLLSHYKEYQSSPDICRAMHGIVKRYTGIDDPYKEVKKRDIQAAEQVYPLLKDFIESKGGELYWVLRTVAAGNVLDSALYQNVDISSSLKMELMNPFAVADMEHFVEKLQGAQRLLVIGDNAGETVFDRLLLEHLSYLECTYAVRSAPIINDATMEDAYASSLGDHAKIITTGCAAPGAIIDECSQEFLDVFYGADLVISKGMGNFEAMTNFKRGVFFLFKAKCPLISRKLEIKLNEYLFKYKEN